MDGPSCQRTALVPLATDINKVLHRIRNSRESPIPGPSQQQIQQQINRAAQFRRGAYVYLAITSKSEVDSGSDYRYSQNINDNYDQEILGVFFSLTAANQCAKYYVQNELGQDADEDDDRGDEMDDEKDDEDDNEDDLEEFCWDGSDKGVYEEGVNAYCKVWVECRAIDDATPRFHP